MSERARSDVLGQPVLSIKEGLLLGRIRQILFDSTVNQVHGFIVERFRGGKDDRILPFSAISSFGEDGIMVESQTLLERRGTSHQYTRSLRHPLPIIGARVFTASGRTLGKVEEYLFSTQDGSITGLEISGGLFRGKMLAPGKYIIAISPQTIMMKDAAIDEAIEVDTSLRFHVSEGLDAMKEREKKNKKSLLYLDEATSAVDQKGATKILRNLTQGKETLLMIAHNLSEEQRALFDREIHLEGK